MKKNLFLFIICILSISFVVKADDFEPVESAIGVSLGTNKGINYLTHNGKGHGYQANLSLDINKSDNRFVFSIDKLFFKAIGNQENPDQGIPIYTGFGVQISDKRREYIGLRAVAGISYFFNQLDDDLEIYAEISPTAYLLKLDDMDRIFEIEYSIGARYYF